MSWLSAVLLKPGAALPNSRYSLFNLYLWDSPQFEQFAHRFGAMLDRIHGGLLAVPRFLLSLGTNGLLAPAAAFFTENVSQVLVGFVHAGLLPFAAEIGQQISSALQQVDGLAHIGNAELFG